MGWLTDAAKSVGIGGDVLKTIEAVDNGAGEAAKAAQTAAVSAAQATVAAAAAPTVVAVALSQGDLKAVESHVAGLVKATSDAASATAKVASAPYFVAADITKDVDGDGAKLLRGAINGKLVEINVVPIILQKIGRLDAKTPEEIAQAIVTAPLEVLLAAYLQAAHDVLEPAARPIPKLIKKQFTGFYDAGLLEKAKYIVSEYGLTLPEAINGTQVFMGNHAFAVTVGNVIVFSREPDSSDSAVHWWAHELHHVEQYDQWGIAGFSEKYVKNYSQIEADADAKADKVVQSL